jgi:hypothetical protein
MMIEPVSISDLISKWGKITHFATDMGCGYEAARQMHRRGSIAPEHWDKVIEISARKKIPGVTIGWLHRQRVSSGEAA